LGAEKRPMITVLNKVDQCENKTQILRLKFKYPKTVEISALERSGFDQLMDAMVREISLLRKLVKLRVPQSHYALVSDVMRMGKVLSIDYEGNDILLEVEIPQHLESKVAHFRVL